MRDDVSPWLHQGLNALQSLVLIVAQVGILGWVGWILAGLDGLVVAAVLCGITVAMSLATGPMAALQFYGARPIHPQRAPELYRALELLTRRGELPAVPVLHYVPSSVLNAFATGSREASAIAITDGLLRTLTRRELVGVLAHELSHVRHNDIWVMALSSAVTRMTLVFSQVGQLILVFFALPAALMGLADVSLGALLILVLSPTAVILLQLALSRTREFDADRGAVALARDPEGLASALAKLERYQHGWWRQILPGGQPRQAPEWLLTHPPTAERIRRIGEYAAALGLEAEPGPTPLAQALRGHNLGLTAAYPVALRRPFWHFYLRG
ncbi:MAG: zinc metalloprotease HtpX [Candidatus Competibacterales bacterium]